MTDQSTYWIESQLVVQGPDTVITVSRDSDDLGMVQLTETEYSNNPDVAPIRRYLRFTPKQAWYVASALRNFLERESVTKPADITE